MQGCFNCLEKISEDAPHKLDIEVQGHNLLNFLVPQVIKYTGHPQAKIRLHSLQILQTLSALRVPAIAANIDGYIAALFSRAADESSDVRKAVCAALGIVLSTRPDKLVPEMKNVIDYIAFCTKDSDELVALEACEFWLTFAEDGQLKDQLRPYLGIVAPLLLAGMVYSEYDLMLLDVDEEDEAVPDKETDIKPKTYSSKVHSHETNDPSSSTGQGKSREAADRALEDEDEDDEDYDDDDEDEEGGGEWNIRKCSAAALDVMAVSFGTELLEVLLPHLKEKLFAEKWEERESGILALGAIAEGQSRCSRCCHGRKKPRLTWAGCMQGIEPHLPQLLPWLLTALKDKKALIRSITCWSLGRYSSWAVHSRPDDKQQFFIPTMEGVRWIIPSNRVFA